MKAISLTQPWASLMVGGIKRYETRSWRTDYRGEIAIHATAARPPDELPAALERICEASFGPDWRMTLPRGRVIGVAKLVACRPAAEVDRIIGAIERGCGDFSPGRFAFELRDMERLEPAVPAQGKLGLWEWDAGSGQSSASRSPAGQGSLL